VTRSKDFAGRRLFLRRGLGIAYTVLGWRGLRPARAQDFPKMSKEEAGYLERREPAARMCGQCVFFIRPDDCRFVQGPISELGTCKYYSD
jgi:hypothetical protein